MSFFYSLFLCHSLIFCVGHSLGSWVLSQFCHILSYVLVSVLSLFGFYIYNFWCSKVKTKSLQKMISKDPMFCNPGDKVLNGVKRRGQICPVILQAIGYCPLDWRTPGLWNVFLTVFQAPWHTCCSWKTLGTPRQCVVFLQSRGQCHD